MIDHLQPVSRQIGYQRRRMDPFPQSTMAAGPATLSTKEVWRTRWNFAIALTALILLMPLIVFIALAVKLSSRGPIIYTQPRVGLDRRQNDNGGERRYRVEDLGGQPFRIYKFRTMTVDAERHSGAVWATKNDPRITVVGGILRKTRLDELPQLINVLRGEMNIVGPRPERPAIFADLRNQVPQYQMRQRTRPGITGLAQIQQQYDTCVEDVRRKVELDLEYLNRKSVLEDLRIMLKTLPVVLFRTGW